MDEIIRRAPTWTQYDKQGADDEQMTKAAQAVIEEEIEVPYTPPLPVPIATAVVRGPNERGKRSSVWLAQPVTTVTSTVGAMANLVGTLGKEILSPEPGKPLVTLPGVDVPFAKNLDELIQAMTKPENLWRVGFVALGAVMIFLGSRLYLTPEAQPIPLKGAV